MNKPKTEHEPPTTGPRRVAVDPCPSRDVTSNDAYLLIMSIPANASCSRATRELFDLSETDHHDSVS